MSEQKTQVGAKPSTTTDRFSRRLRNLYRLSIVIIAAFVVLSTILFVGRAAVYKIHAYERGLHLRGGRFVSVDEPGWHVQIPLVDTVIIVKVNERLGYIERLDAMTSDDVTMIVSLQYTYRVTNPERFALEVDDPERLDEEMTSQPSESGRAFKLESFAVNLTELARQKKLDPLIGREVEMKRIIQVLCRRKKNNPALIGEPGVGKTAIAEGLAERISGHKVPHILMNRRLVTLDLASIVAGTKYRGQFEERLKAVMNEIRESDNVIIFIIHLLFIILNDCFIIIYLYFFLIINFNI